MKLTSQSRHSKFNFQFTSSPESGSESVLICIVEFILINRLKVNFMPYIYLRLIIWVVVKSRIAWVDIRLGHLVKAKASFWNCLIKIMVDHRRNTQGGV